MDSDGYPTEETLRRIREWSMKTPADFIAVMDFAGRAWNHHYGSWRIARVLSQSVGEPKESDRYTFSTGGWSGNESVVDAIEHNRMLQMIGAYSWRRGGHYEYRFDAPKSPPSPASEGGERAGR
jgi:hypothetical protein